jgi:transcriptional antiterminator RfaH
MPYWTVARTHPNCEKIAIQNLERQNFTHYQPIIQERKIRRKKLQTVESPLFPCYLFIQVVDKWRSLNSTYGIAGIVNGIVNESIINDLKSREVGGIIQLPKPRTFTVGDKVTIGNGMFAGQQALVERMTVKQRQGILLSLLSSKIKVLIDESDILAA